MLPHLAPRHLAPSLPGRTALVGAVQRWAVESQQRARRNAMLATTECVRRRVEREDVEDFLSARYPAAVVSPDTLRRSRG